MADADKSKAEQVAKRVAEWLARNEEALAQGGVERGTCPQVLGMSGDEVTEAVAYLESREEVARSSTLWSRRPE